MGKAPKEKDQPQCDPQASDAAARGAERDGSGQEPDGDVLAGAPQETGSPSLNWSVPDLPAPPGEPIYGLFLSNGAVGRLESYRSLPELVGRLRELYGVDGLQVFAFHGVPLRWTDAPARCLVVGGLRIPLFPAPRSVPDGGCWRLDDQGVVREETPLEEFSDLDDPEQDDESLDWEAEAW